MELKEMLPEGPARLIPDQSFGQTKLWIKSHRAYNLSLHEFIAALHPKLVKIRKNNNY